MAGTSVLGQRQWTLQVGLAQSSMASSWSARASNMVLMSSRMCLVEVLGGLQGGSTGSDQPIDHPASPGQGPCY